MCIASDYPYTYTDLMRFLNNTCTEKAKDKIRKATLCKTLCGNIMPMLIITNFESSEHAISLRPAIILSARVHPGYFQFYDKS